MRAAEAIEAALCTDQTVDITTTGARTGRPHRVEIWFVRVAGRVFITGTPRPRDWLANLRADPRLTFHLKESIQADLPATAREVVDTATRSMVLDAPETAWYRERVDRDELVARAPMVEITFVREAADPAPRSRLEHRAGEPCGESSPHED
jgi:hypothetical protein